MSKNKKMIVVTYKYPFEPPVEVFLHNELEYTKNEASKVVLLTTARNVDKNETYNFDEKFNVVILEESKRSFADRISGFLELCKTMKYVLIDIRAAKWDFYSAKNIIKCYVWAANKLSKTVPKLQEILQNEPSEILVYSYWFGSFSVYACMLKNWLSKYNKECSIKMISRAHGQGDLYYDQKIKSRPGKSYFDHNIDAIYPISDDGKELLMQEFPNIEVITQHLGVDGAGESNHSCHRGTFIIVSCSTINENKRVENIAKTIFSIRSINIKWVHFGDGDGFEKLKTFVNTMRPNNIEVDLIGNTKNSDIISFYSNDRPDLFINLSLIEGVPVSIMEAMAYSIPVIATKVGAVTEIVVNNKNGYLVEVDAENEQIALMIQSYLKRNIEERNVFRQNAYNTWKDKFRSDKNYTDFAKKMW